MKGKQLIGVSLAGLAIAISLGTFNEGKAVERSTIDLATLHSSTVSQHNTYRAVHHAPDLTSDNSLKSSAQDWANQLASTGVFEHSGVSGVGENLYVSYTTQPSIIADTLATSAIQAWYEEVADYNYANPGFSSATGHFTQVVWQGSTQLGCGAAQGAKTINGRQYNAFYVVCHYAPPGNVLGQFSANVQQP